MAKEEQKEKRKDQKSVMFRVPEELRKQAKIKAAQEGRPLQVVLEELLREWLTTQSS